MGLSAAIAFVHTYSTPLSNVAVDDGVRKALLLAYKDPRCSSIHNVTRGLVSNPSTGCQLCAAIMQMFFATSHFITESSWREFALLALKMDSPALGVGPTE